MSENQKKHSKRRKKYEKDRERHCKNREKYYKSREKNDEIIEEKVKKEPKNELSENDKTKQLKRYNNEIKDRFMDKANELKQCNKKLQTSHVRYHRKVTRDYAVSPDNTLREITGDMPNLELKHVLSNETIYTDDQLM
ncbi:unnamed protein product [Brugia pahangi]|uniref:Nucleolar protein 16 n=1 Tax=Brugia pahangi TaxID=6280 RepID=A0A0N4TRK8_BRUPA|nr:unnamed protein product [Brugia pahangi]